MTQTARYPGLLAIQADYTASVSGCGREKSDDKPVSRLDVNCSGPEYNQIVVELIAAQQALGTTMSVPADYGDGNLGSLREALQFKTVTTSKAGFIEHFLQNPNASIPVSNYMVEKSTASSDGGSNYTDRIGVRRITLGATTAEGWEQTVDRFYQRTVLVHCAWEISALPGTDGDYFEMGIENSVATSWVRFISTRASGVWPDWTVEIDDGVAAPTTDTFPNVAPDTDRHTFTILATSTGATFWMDIGTAGQEKKELTAAPDDDLGTPYIEVKSASGGETHDTDIIACFDTRTF